MGNELQSTGRKFQNATVTPSPITESKFPFDFGIFDDIDPGDHCHGEQHDGKCKAVERIVTALGYYHQLVFVAKISKYGQDPQMLFTSFCEDLYPKKQLLNDYIHWVNHHGDEEEMLKMRRQLQFDCDLAKECGAATRHYRDRRQNNSGNAGVKPNWFTDKMDSIHFNLYHLHELGLRVKMDAMNGTEDMVSDDDEKGDGSHLKSSFLMKMSKEIKSKMGKFSAHRLDAAENSKYTIPVQEQIVSEYGIANKGGMTKKLWNRFAQKFKKKETVKSTKRDYLMQQIWNRRQDVEHHRALYEFMEKHDVDTDCFEDDLEIFREENSSHFHRAMGGDDESMNHILSIWRQQRILSRSFATGIPLFYWKWYRKATEKDVTKSWYLSKMVSGGYSPAELSVSPHFKNLKEEVVETGLLSPAQFEDLVVQKAAEYLSTAQCRKMKSTKWGVLLHFDIPYNSSLTAQHLQSIILYCDFTELCTLFSLSLRKNEWDDGLKEIKARNAKFYYFSKKLRELVTCFGSDGGRGGGNGVVNGPFFSGVSVVLNVSAFNIGFNTPTSTSKSKEIAWRFAGEEGMMITVNNRKGSPTAQPVLNATWISAFAEENEYLWFGSVHGVSLVDIAIVSSYRVYRPSLYALSLFDAVLSGQYMKGMESSKNGTKILSFCIKHALNDSDPSAPKGVDEYVLENVYSFTQKKNKILLKLHKLNREDVALNDLIFYGVVESLDVPSGRANIFRSSIFNLFPNLIEVELVVSSWYRLNLLSLLSVLNESVIPSSFKVIKIKSAWEWLNIHFESIPNVKEQFAAKNWIIEQEILGDYICIFIKKQQ